MPFSQSPKISVLLPVFNTARTLPSALQSVLSQSFTDFEVLVIDDGSTDGSAAIANSFGDARVRLLGDRERHGLAARLNQGIDAARGAYIARMDGDDLCFPERLRLQADFLDAHPQVDLVGGQAVVFRDGGAVIGLHPFALTHEAICAQPWRSFHLPHPTWMGRSEWFRNHRYRLPEIMRAEDQELLLRAYPDSRFACIGQVVLAYRQGGFDFRRTWRARRALLAAQLGHFIRRRQPGNAARAVAMTTMKVMVDMAAALPGCQRLFFCRMAEPVSPEILEQLRQWGIGVQTEAAR